MHLIDVKVIGLQAAQTLLNALKNVLARKPFAVRSGAGGKENLGGQHHVIATAFQSYSQDFLGAPVGVTIGGINEIAPLVEVGIQDRQRFLFIAARRPAHGRQASKCHCAQTDFRNL